MPVESDPVILNADGRAKAVEVGKQPYRKTIGQATPSEAPVAP